MSSKPPMTFDEWRKRTIAGVMARRIRGKYDARWKQAMLAFLHSRRCQKRLSGS